MSKLFLTNIPYNCSDDDILRWIALRGVEARAVRTVRDLVAGVSPAFGYVDLKDQGDIKAAVSMLNGKKIGDRTIQVQEAA